MAKAGDKSKRSQVRPGVRRVLLWSLRSGKLFALLVLGAAGWLLYQALSSPEYAVRQVTTRGTTALTAEDVEALADVTGRSIWFVRDDEVAARIRQSPYVERVAVQVLLPDSVVVQVTERRPEVRWTHAGTTYAVTWEGLVLDDTPPALGESTALSATAALSETATAVPGPAFVSSVAIVDTTPNRDLKPGDKVDPDALEIARRVTLRAAELPVPLQRVEWDAGLGVSLIVGDNRQAVIGKSERLDEKLAILTHLLRDGTPFSYLDLRSTTPSYR